MSISPNLCAGGLPVWIGGASPAAIRRTARIGTGWLAGSETPAEAARVVSAIRAAAESLPEPAASPVPAVAYDPFR